MKSPELLKTGNTDNVKMGKPVITMTVIKEDAGYSAFSEVENKSMFTVGESFDELKSNIIEVVNLTFEESGFIFTIDEIKLTFDLESFFDFYSVINAKALSKRIGMNQSLLAQYIKGIKKPSPVQVKRILSGVQQIGRELTEVNFLL